MTDPWSYLIQQGEAQIKLEREFRDSLPKLCEDCGKNWADWPSKLCPGCEAYREHTGAL